MSADTPVSACRPLRVPSGTIGLVLEPVADDERQELRLRSEVECTVEVGCVVARETYVLAWNPLGE
jgi:hypothetical protein